MGSDWQTFSPISTSIVRFTDLFARQFDNQHINLLVYYFESKRRKTLPFITMKYQPAFSSTSNSCGVGGRRKLSLLNNYYI